MKWLIPVEGMAFAGGYKNNVPGGKVYSANITPHPVTGIGAWSKEVFEHAIIRFVPDASTE